MGTTPNFDLRYPELGDAANVPLSVEQLASDVDEALAIDPYQIQRGKAPITPVANTMTSVTITFDEPYDSIPIVQVTVESTSSAVTGATFSDVTTTNFKAWILRTNTTVTNIAWLAIKA